VAGASLGPFTLAEPLGEGAHAVVYRAVHRPTQRPVAVKLLKGDDRRASRALEREVQAVAALSHPGIVEVYDTGLVPRGAGDGLVAGTRWLALELATHGSLADRGPKRYGTVRQILLQVLSALAHAHARGVVHRDLKPANVLRSGRRLKLADFGLAFAVGQARGPRIAGTPAYMAPEQVRGEADRIGPWTDLYAVGCIAWELTTGRPPFVGDAQELFDRHLGEEPGPFLPRMDVPADLEAWLRRRLAKDPRDRGDNAALVAAALLEMGTDLVDGVARPPTGGEADPRTWTESLSQWFDPDDLARVEGEAYEGDPWLMPRADWHLAERSRPPVWLLGASLGLYTLRAVPVVGRIQERNQLWASVRHVASQRRATTVSVVGEPGMGCTAMGRWLTLAVKEGGYGAVVLGPSDDPGGLEALWAEVRAWMHRGLVVVWVDEPSTEVAEALVAQLHTSELQGAPVLVLLTGGSAVPGARQVELLAMADPVIERLCCDVAGVSAQAARQLARRVGGVPGDALQLLRALVDQDRLVHGRDGFDVPSGFDHLPPTRAQRGAQDIAALVADAGTGLHGVAVAALVGERASHGAWVRLCERVGVAADPDGFLPLLEAGLVTWSGRWHFHSGTVADGVLAQLEPAERVQLAGAVADGLAVDEELRGCTTLRARLALRAERYEEALDLAVATPPALVTPRTRWVARAARAHLHLAPDDPREVWLDLGGLTQALDHDASESLRQGMELLAGLRGEARRIALPLVASTANYAGKPELALQLVEESLSIKQTPFLLRKRALLLERLDRMGEAERTARRALAVARAEGDELEAMVLTNDVADWDRVHGRIEQAEAGFREALSLVTIDTPLEVQAVARENLAQVLVDRGAYRDALAEWQRVIDWTLERSHGHVPRLSLWTGLCCCAAHLDRWDLVDDGLVRLEAAPRWRLVQLGVEGHSLLLRAAALASPARQRRMADVVRRAGDRVFEMASTKAQHGFFGSSGGA